LREVLETTPPNKTKLQQILSGSVTPSLWFDMILLIPMSNIFNKVVNAGAVAICTSFLTKEDDAAKGTQGDCSEYSSEQIETLRKDLDYFLLLCAFAIKLHKSLVGSEQQQLHQQVCYCHFTGAGTTSILMFSTV